MNVRNIVSKNVDFSLLYAALNKPKIVDFVKRLRLANYKQQGEKEFADLSKAFDKAIEMLAKTEGKSRDIYRDTVLKIIYDIFKKDDPQFWFNKQEDAYRNNTKADHEFEFVKNYFLPGNIIDIGCGSGSLAVRISESGRKILLTDVLDYRIDSALKLDFKRMRNIDKLPINGSKVDNAMMFLVFHHMSNVVFYKTLQELKNKVKRIIVKEDLYDVPKTAEFDAMRADDPFFNEFGTFTKEDQFLILTLSDYISNVFIQGISEMPFTFNFKSYNEWVTVFNSNNFKLVDSKVIGMRRGDTGLVGSCHGYFIVDVIN